MTPEANTTYAKDRQEWRSWLLKHHESNESVWLVYYKARSGQPSVSHLEAIEEALCFGWIDGRIKTIDADRYMQRYSPRKPKSLWSELNIQRAQKMIQLGSMTEAGFKAFDKAMATKERIPSSKDFVVPPYLKKALMKHQEAWRNFQSFPPSAQLAFVYWVGTAKTTETRQRRVRETVDRVSRNLKFGEA